MSTPKSWQADLSHALQARDRHEKAFDDIIAAYGTLATRLAAAPAPAPADPELRADLAAAQQTARQLEGAERERARLERRCRDLADEARSKDRELQHVQDEMLALNMELNMVLQREEATKKDNKELLDRWMALKGKEAEEMNRASQWE